MFIEIDEYSLGHATLPTGTDTRLAAVTYRVDCRIFRQMIAVCSTAFIPLVPDVSFPRRLRCSLTMLRSRPVKERMATWYPRSRAYIKSMVYRGTIERASPCALANTTSPSPLLHTPSLLPSLCQTRVTILSRSLTRAIHEYFSRCHSASLG